MANLPEPHFIDRDPRAILAECIAWLEARLERPVQPAQAERLLADLIAYRESLVRQGIQDAAKQNLVRYARFPMIDLLAEIIGGGRLAATPAKTTERFDLPAALGVPTPVPQGTRIRTKDGRITFTTDVDKVITAGETFVEVSVTATEAGPIGNGYAPGQVTEIVDDLGVTITATNLTETKDGSAAEDSERLRERFPDILGEYAAAGPEDAYRAHALAAHPDVLDAWIESPEPGVARVHVLATYGVPTNELLDIVEAALSSEDVRPICDLVEVVAAVEVTYALTASLDLRSSGADVDDVLEAGQAAAEDFAAERRRRLGRSIVRTQVASKLSKAEYDEESEAPKYLALGSVYRVNLAAPAADVILARNQFATCTGITITFGSFVEDP